MDKEKLAKRYRYLWTGEATSSILFVALLLIFAVADGVWSRWILRSYSVAVVVIVLSQSVVWWRWKLRLLSEGRRQMPSQFVANFGRLRWLNWALIAGFALAVLAKRWLIGELPADRDLWLGLMFLGGAVLEQINYYYYQLMYDNSYDWNYLRTERRLRRGTIAKVLARNERRSSPENRAGTRGSDVHVDRTSGLVSTQSEVEHSRGDDPHRQGDA